MGIIKNLSLAIWKYLEIESFILVELLIYFIDVVINSIIFLYTFSLFF